MIKFLTRCIIVTAAAATLAGCSGSGMNIEEIRVGTHNNNELKIQINVTTTQPVNVYAEYWKASGNDTGKVSSTISHNTEKHSLILCNVIAQTDYAYHIITEKNGVKKEAASTRKKRLSSLLRLQSRQRRKSSNLARPSSHSWGTSITVKRVC